MKPVIADISNRRNECQQPIRSLTIGISAKSEKALYMQQNKNGSSQMKTWLFILLSCFSALWASGQYEVAPYQQTKALPPFELQQADNSIFTKAKLQKDRPVIIMFFSPGCDHCLHQTEAMLKRIKDLAKYQIVMATYQPIEELQEFNKKYQLSKYPNIVTGRDVKYILPPFYHIQNFPYLAFYDKTGKLLSSFEGNLSVDEMLKRFK